VVLASRGYPASSEKGIPVEGLENCKADNCVIFHAGTDRKNGKYVTAGGRVVGVTSIDSTMKGALERAYECIDKISFDGMQFRRDIGRKAGNFSNSFL
jgi:phosphoribosylamine--glycine ligase